VVREAGREIAEPRVVVTSAGRVDAVTGRVDISAGELLSTSLSLRTGGLVWLPATPGATLADRLRGRLQWQADVGRVEPWLVPAAIARAWPAAGRGWGTVEIIDTQAGVNLLVEATGSQLALAAAGRDGVAPQTVWAEPRIAGALEVTRPRGTGGLADQLRIDRLTLESSTLAVAATGRLDDWASRRVVTLDGTAAYDWQQVSRLLSPWTGGRLALVGSDSRPFTLRMPLAADTPAAVAAAPDAPPPATVQLPADWLAATRGTEPEPELAMRVARPASASIPPTGRARLSSVTVDTTAAWAGGEIEGFTLEAGEVPLRLLEGQLAFGPFDIPVAGGRVRGAPWVRLVPAPGELVVPPGRLVEGVALSEQACRRIARWLSPVLGHATHATGAVSVDVAGARIPFGDAFGGEFAGQLMFENLEVRPAPAVQPLVNLLVKLQSVVDPRFAFGDKAVLLRVRPDPVRVRLAGRRIAHDGLVMDSGQLVVKSQGSVGHDGSLDMRLEVALRGDLVGQTPVLGTLFRTPLVVPLRGTVEKPQFDAAAMDSILSRIVENTAEAVIKDGIGRGLEAVFGQPPPAAPGARPPASLTLPPP
jgi:translocation and assembly module TamB